MEKNLRGKNWENGFFTKDDFDLRFTPDSYRDYDLQFCIYSLAVRNLCIIFFVYYLLSTVYCLLTTPHAPCSYRLRNQYLSPVDR